MCDEPKERLDLRGRINPNGRHACTPGGSFVSANENFYPDLDIQEVLHQYGISAVVTQMSLSRGDSGETAKRRLFTQDKWRPALNFSLHHHKLITRAGHVNKGNSPNL